MFLGISIYWLNYIVGFFCIVFFFKVRRIFPFRTTVDVLTAGWFGMILGARLFYVLFYYPSYYYKHPDQIPAFWNGGMSFHGALLVGALTLWICCRAKKISFKRFCDELSLIVPIFLGLGRIGNFINGELPGRVTDVPWAVVFDRFDQQLRHPSPLYEAIFEGPVLFLLVYFCKQRRFEAFVIGYSVIRFVLEFFREPDEQLGFFFGGATLGQIFSLLMCGVGVWMLRKNPSTTELSRSLR